MNEIQRTAVVQEFEAYLKSKGIHAYKETPFKELMETTRRFRADYSFTNPVNAADYIVEINGGSFINGRHNRGGKGYETDLYKVSLACSSGYRVLQFTYEMLARQEYKDFL